MSRLNKELGLLQGVALLSTSLLGTGIFVNPELGGTGVWDYVANAVAPFDAGAQFMAQLTGVITALIWSSVVAAVVLLVLKYTILFLCYYLHRNKPLLYLQVLYFQFQ